MVYNDFDLPGDEWFDEEFARWNTGRKRQYMYVLLDLFEIEISLRYQALINKTYTWRILKLHWCLPSKFNNMT